MRNMEELLEEMELAMQDFNYASEEYIDAAIYNLAAVEERMNLYIKETKKPWKEVD